MTDLDPDRIRRAAAVIDPSFQNSPQYVDGQLCARLGRQVLTKIETVNRLRCFKGRGADVQLSGMDPAVSVVCASAGNFGMAIADAARRRGMSSDVFLATGTTPVKVARIEAAGGRPHLVDGDPKAAAAAFADADPKRQYVVDGREAAIAEGAGTIGVELLRDHAPDTIVLPLGDGALITGVACWVKARRPGIRIVGVTSAAAPALAQSWRIGEAVTVAPTSRFAAGIVISTPTAEAVPRTRELVDDIVLVDDAELRAAMHLTAQTLGVLPEAAGAAGIAALMCHEIPGELVATVITGANADLAAYADLARPSSTSPA